MSIKSLEQSMNQVLADMNLLYRKLQNYHWNIKGKEFFVLHAKLEEFYDGVNGQIDEVAEQLLMLGGQPLGRMEDYLKIGKIQEAANEKVSADVVFKSVLADFEYMKASLVSLKKEADDAGIYELSALADSLIAPYSKNIWMLKQSQE